MRVVALAGLGRAPVARSGESHLGRAQQLLTDGHRAQGIHRAAACRARDGSQAQGWVQGRCRGTVPTAAPARRAGTAETTARSLLLLGAYTATAFAQQWAAAQQSPRSIQDTGSTSDRSEIFSVAGPCRGMPAFRITWMSPMLTPSAFSGWMRAARCRGQA